jgi:DNA-directed RNA polymerase specialized sigma24 family protein
MSRSREQDAELVRRIVSGEREAFEELDALYRKRIYGYIKPRVRNDADALNITQDTLLKFFKNPATYDSDIGGLLNYLQKAAFHTHLDEIGRAFRIHELQAEPEDIETLEIKHLLGTDGIGLLREDEMLKFIFGELSPPHQLIAFGFSYRLGWKPEEIVADLSEKRLKLLEGKLEDDYSATSILDDRVVRDRFKLLRNNMIRSLGDVLIEPQTRKAYQSFLDTPVGETTLNQYFTHDDPRKDISYWCYSARRRLAGAIGAPSPEEIER